MLVIVLLSVIVGLALVVLAVLFGKNSRMFIGLGVIGAALMFYAGFGYGSMNSGEHFHAFEIGNKAKVKYPIEEVQLISPVDGDEVSCRILTMGVYPENHEKDIWILLRPSDKKYYPQSDFTEQSYKENGEWQVVTRFGGDMGEIVDVVVFETDSSATRFFGDIITMWKLEDKYVGLQSYELPPGATEIQRIQVTLGGNCRGVH